MAAIAIKLIPNLLAWAGIMFGLFRGFPGQRKLVGALGAAGFALGAAGTAVVFRSFPGDLSYGIIRNIVGCGFLLFWGVSVATLYSSTGRRLSKSLGVRLVHAPLFAAACSVSVGAVAGIVCGCRLAASESYAVALVALVLAACALALAAAALDRWLPASLTVSPSGLVALVVALLLFSTSSLIRLDLFAPLTMKVMKFTHDFVHQFFESMLIPDHLFIRSYLWGYIGLLFGEEIGLWGGLFIWFTPVLLIMLAIGLERLPTVSHIRQGAQRRKLLAAAITARRLKLVIPVIAALILAAAVYRSRFPSVEYWDPKPVLIGANAAGEIVIPKKGEVDLEDGKLHKYLFKKGDREARFFVLMNPSGKLTVDLDACAICKPDGYGQAEGTVICYYCKTLIPLETVGSSGGCNPVPIAFSDKEDAVHIDGLTLINKWSDTVQSTARVKEGGK
jgi:uncharacterized membrane protein